MKLSEALNVVARRASPAPAPPDAAEIARRLEAARAEVARLEAEHGPAALDAECGAEGAEERLGALTALLARARSGVARLDGAYVAAQDREKAAARTAVAALQQIQMRAVRQHVAERDKAAMELAVALDNATVAWKTLVDRSMKAMSANPAGGSWPSGSLCSMSELHVLVQHELWRLSADPAIGSKSALPGAQAPIDFVHNPGGLPKLIDQVRAGSEHTIAVLTGRIAG